MGSVLENGLYLPDEGERNAYNGLKGNWNTLDNLVETVTALSSTGLIRKKVDALPITDIQTNVIYMLKATKPNGDVYRIEYMYIDDHWDPVGTSETTLDDYYTKTETNDLPAVKSGVNATKVSNYDTHLADTDIHVTLANKQTWDGKQNALDTAQTAAVNSGITGTKVTGYDTHVSDTDIHVTASDKTAWNSKQDGLSQTQLAAVNSGVTGTKVTAYDSHVADTDIHVTTTDKATWNGKQDALTQTQLDNIASIPDKANSADLATVATTGDYTDLTNAPTIPTVNNAMLTIQKNGTDVATFTANASSNVTANLLIPVNTSDLNNDAGFLTQHNPIDNELSATSENALQNKVVKSELDGKAPLVHTHAASDVTSGTFNIARIPNLDASKITSGTIDIARLPKGSLERLIKVADQTARYALTTDDVQLGDTVQQLDTGVMYVVTDDTKLDSADGYTEFTAGSASSVPWTGVTGKPSDYPPSSHTHTKSQITDFPTLATVATSGEYSDLNNIPASFTPSSHVHGNLTNDGALGTTQGKPVVTGIRGILSTGSFGTTAGTFCEGNDSRLSDARTPLSHTHTKSDVTDLFNSANTWSANNTYSADCIIYNSDNSGSIATLKLRNSKAEILSTGNTSSDQSMTFRDKNDVAISYIKGAVQSNGAALKIGAYAKDSSNNTVNTELQLLAFSNGNKAIFPATTNEYDLGISSFQWKSIFAKNYYYNGTAWGLDKNNTWTGNNTFTAKNLFHIAEDPSYILKSSTMQEGVVPSGNRIVYAGCWQDKNSNILGYDRFVFYSTGLQTYEVNIRNKATNGSFDPNGSLIQSGYQLSLYPSGNSELKIYAHTLPNGNGVWNLGDSTHKWKTLNGINPGALSLPDYNSYVDVTSNIPVASLDGTQIDLNTYLADKTGWLSIVIADTTGNYITVTQGRAGGSTVFNNSRTFHTGAQSNGYISVFFPIIAGMSKFAFIKASSLIQMRFYYCLGNA